ncbi:SPRY domain-containing SOCS box protein 3-like [Tigriopus californicus]|uniref:SPRY domain-containing SOCS box protein 3-like n=1 Tax=Tigriopus californicus TaxID=6832 RepID=UPI0027D9EC8C|nr:SPRY domain-containing SOCS box protein 3-like [Tigriopus californicus]XP_059090139.1 SPRY domain-containing SOCS box protein 3-like [Tigriopus californicus]|eukprot:TCALIF_11236-PA protein Name:"Similar to spsb3 SPRY domain-containing SOCS box protein 3 (Xenopus laevis)" AED:0.02 eAED:0.02 QI:217/1/1/1/0.5/0.33/3/633/263
MNSIASVGPVNPPVGPEDKPSEDGTQLPLAFACVDHWSWNPSDKSREVLLNGPKDRIAHFHPNWSNGTAGVRGTRVLNNARYYWEINVFQRIFGTSMMFGIGTKDARLHVDAFVNMLGEDDQSWGLSHKGYIWHNGRYKYYTRPFRENVSTTIGVFFDGISGTLTYYKDGVSLGVAFTGLRDIKEPLFPIVCSTAAKTEMGLGMMKRDFISLLDRCRSVILQHLTKEEQLDELCLPKCLKNYISEGLEDFQADVQLSQNNFTL